MDRRRELTLQRLARIGALPASENVLQVEKPVSAAKLKPVGTMTIEAAINVYMKRQKSVYAQIGHAQFEHDLRTQQDSYVSTSKDPKRHLSQQMAEYMAAIEESQLANVRAGVNYDKSAEELNEENKEKAEKALRTDRSARYQLEHYRKQQEVPSSIYDKLDENRCPGFLLYSYDKNGGHSVLGENISPGSYGGRITSGSFVSKA
ncbi:MAG: hypothetical protein K2N90_03130 [Lachnospiraceae bacterium]|nr:hypothetical protein [Lachnospiraceae bacterium]